MKYLFFILTSGLLYGFSFLFFPYWILIFFMFVPIFYLDKDYFLDKIPKTRLFFYYWTIFLIAHCVALHWIAVHNFLGAISLWVANSLFMTSAMFLFSILHKKSKTIKNKFINSLFFKYLLFVSCWLSLEQIRLFGDFAFPWLNLGNVLANYTEIIQWYCFSGFLGGSFWVLTINFLFFQILEQKSKNYIYLLLLIIFIPIIISFFLLQFSKNEKKISVLVAHPCVDRYSTNKMTEFGQIAYYQKLLEKNINAHTEYAIFPETALQLTIWEKKFNEYYPINILRNNIITKYPKLKIIIGGIISETTNSKIEAKKDFKTNKYFKSYNAILQIDSSKNIQFRTKKI